MLPNTLIAAGVAAVLIAGGAYYKGREAGMEKYHAYKTEVAAASAIIAADNARIIREAEERSRELAAGYAASSRELHDSYNSRLRRATSNCATSAIVAGAAAGTDGRPSNNRPVEAAPTAPGYEDICERLEKDCAVTTLRFVWLREWVKGVCK